MCPPCPTSTIKHVAIGWLDVCGGIAWFLFNTWGEIKSINIIELRVWILGGFTQMFCSSSTFKSCWIESLKNGSVSPSKASIKH